MPNLFFWHFCQSNPLFFYRIDSDEIPNLIFFKNFNFKLVTRNIFLSLGLGNQLIVHELIVCQRFKKAFQIGFVGS